MTDSGRCGGDAAVKCRLEWCNEPADAGRWCRTHWTDGFERSVAVYAYQDADHLARLVTQAQCQMDFLVAHGGVGNEPGACCGHLLRVHTEGGCFGQKRQGLSQHGYDYTPCDCLAWDALSGSDAR